MATSFDELSRLLDRSIVRVPDAMTRAERDSDYFYRKEFANELAACMGAKHVINPAIYLTLPFQLCLLTDPHLFEVIKGHLILDHPTVANDGNEYWLSQNCAYVGLHARHSLYQNRYPRMIALNGAGKANPVELSKYTNELMYRRHEGPFEKIEPSNRAPT